MFGVVIETSDSERYTGLGPRTQSPVTATLHWKVDLDSDNNFTHICSCEQRLKC